MWDWQYFVEHSPYSVGMWKIFWKVLSVPNNIVMNLNYVMPLPSSWWCIWCNYRINISLNYKTYHLISFHNIIKIHNNVLWDWNYSTKHSQISTHSVWMWKYLEMFCEILLVPHNIVMDMNNVILDRRLVFQLDNQNHKMIGFDFHKISKTGMIVAYNWILINPLNARGFWGITKSFKCRVGPQGEGIPKI